MATDDEPIEGSEAVNLKRAAMLLGVHYMTAYRYVRQGRLAAERDGTQWRVRTDSIAAFRTGGITGRPAQDRPGPDWPGPDWPGPDWAARLEIGLVAGDEVTAWQTIEAALAAGHPPEFCYLEMIATALAAIGERWSAGELEIADQHIASAVAMRLVARLGARFRRPGRTRGTFVFGAPLGEMHSAPIAIVSDLVRLGGYDVLELGANVPPDAFAQGAARVARLVAIGIGVAQEELAPQVQATIDAVRASDPRVPIVVGGLAAAALERAGLSGATAFARDGAHALEIIAALASVRAVRRVV